MKMDILSDVKIDGTLEIGGSNGSVMKLKNSFSNDQQINFWFPSYSTGSSVNLFVTSGADNKSINFSEFNIGANKFNFYVAEQLSNGSVKIKSVSTSDLYDLIKSKSIITGEITIPAGCNSEIYFKDQKFCYMINSINQPLPKVDFFERLCYEVEVGSSRTTEVIMKRVEIDYGFYTQACDYYCTRLYIKPTASDVERTIYLVAQP